MIHPIRMWYCTVIYCFYDYENPATQSIRRDLANFEKTTLVVC